MSGRTEPVAGNKGSEPNRCGNIAHMEIRSDIRDPSGIDARPNVNSDRQKTRLKHDP
jgi:hypothetical protein